MLCQKCNKNTATIVMQEDTNGIKQESFLCKSCSENIEISMLLEDLINEMMYHFDVRPRDDKKCSGCGCTIHDFKSVALLGCAACYKAFHTELDNIIGGTQKSMSHKGKFPKRGGAPFKHDRDIARLRTHMQKAIDIEDFTTAAKLRDQIKKLNNPNLS